ncbi:hypothetical protein CTEN210_17768 [Chaetoceros tenuissimus]|uniref:MYND-type domain-containing protein n=1 Tax=Chaetoceros tenuissimus TaxID=426638 RepID=A0AAD3HEU3_9STRA|nr:hypothetical protein CTEN210_17768 [Chaetoceros tenuissimus]
MTSTTTSTKPNGICASCKKEGALRRCVPCKNVGIDVFFCNQECQIKLWKTHRAVCGKVSTTDPKKEKSQTKKKGKGSKKCDEVITCENCGKYGKQIGCKLSICSKCRGSYYCSRECQVAYWPTHKALCNKNREMLKKCSFNSTQTKIVDLLDDWRVSPAAPVSVAIMHALGEEGIRQQPPTKFTMIDVYFDCNAETFLISKDPYAIPIADMEPEDKKFVLETYERDSIKSRGRSDPVYHQFGNIRCYELGISFGKISSMAISESKLRKQIQSGIDLRAISMRLKSKLFRGWNIIRAQNVQKQIDHLKQKPMLSKFVQNALQKKHLTHRLIVELRMRHEIGQIYEFEKYRVVSVSVFQRHFDYMRSKRSGYREVSLGELDATASPQHSAKKMMVPILFEDGVTGCFFFSSISFDETLSGNTCVRKSKKDADKCFRKLQQLVKQMPSELIEKVSL